MASEFQWDQKSRAYYLRHRLSNWQYCMIAFLQWRQWEDTCYSVAFAVADKKKNLNGWFNEDKRNNIELKSTGHCGIEALIWCRDRLLDFEKEVFRAKTGDTRIVVGASDKRRFRVYERALQRYGYKKVFVGGEWVMVKTLT